MGRPRPYCISQQSQAPRTVNAFAWDVDVVAALVLRVESDKAIDWDQSTKTLTVDRTNRYYFWFYGLILHIADGETVRET